MITSLSNATQNPLLDSLVKVFSQSLLPVECLVITDNNQQIKKRLLSALHEESTAVLEIPQEDWDFSDSKVCGAIEWVLKNGGVKEIVLAGHSKQNRVQDSVSIQIYKRDAQKQYEDNYSKLVTGVKNVNSQTVNAQERFVSKVKELSQLIDTRINLAGNRLVIHGIFYRTEAGLFLRYHFNEGKLMPIC